MCKFHMRREHNPRLFPLRAVGEETLEKMTLQGHLTLVICMGAMVSFSMAFNIDVANPQHYPGDKEDFFGYKALQYKGKGDKEKWVLVSAPLQSNGTGGIYKCAHNAEDCTPINLTETVSVKSIGLSMAVDSDHLQFTSCSPSLVHECYGNSYLNSVCYQFNSQLQITSKITAAFQECTKKSVDLVFLIDGSGSMKNTDFEQNKLFIKKIMADSKNDSNDSMQFAAVQFSKDIKTVFTFKDYQEGKALDNLDEEEHMAGSTNTHKAINHTLKYIFDNSTAGANPEATMVMVIITDGNPTDKDFYNAVNESDKRNIIRFIIGVGTLLDLTKLKALASVPKDNNTFHIEDYNGLKGILKNLQIKIFKIEGSQNVHSGDWTKELSQSGFSAAYLKGTLVLGSVGSNSWRGSLYEIKDPTSEELEIQDPSLDGDSYMGYSVAVGMKNQKALYFSGAPRFNHTGLVILFSKVQNKWNVNQKVKGEQIGSYFGAELCAVDIDEDGDTNFLLVGAPLYHQSHPQKEGMMFVYTLTAEPALVKKMSIERSSQGRFASSISSLRDLNGDGLRDVAVGAPLEDEQRGVVYIYLGEKQTCIRPEPSQRITARTVSPQLQQFGLTIDGKLDLGEDGLTDIVIGARGGVVLLRSRPVLNVMARLQFHPSEISTINFDCFVKKTVFPVVILTTCFHMTEKTKSQAGTVGQGLTVSYQLDVDSVRKRSRAYLNDTDTDAARSLLASIELTKEETCFNHTVYMPNCVRDTLSPITIKLNFSQSENNQNKSNGILNTDSGTAAMVEVPFQKNCKRTENCISDLELDFNFITPTLIVVDQDPFEVILKLSNNGDDSYNTSLDLHYPPGLSFSTLIVTEASRTTLTKCDDHGDVLDRTTCSVSLPVYRSQTIATFRCLFRIFSKYDWNDTMEIRITANSDNGNSTNNTLSKVLPVQYAVDLAVTHVDEDSVTYINFSLEDRGPKMVLNIFEVKNLGFKSLPVTVTFTFPTQIGNNFEIKDHKVSAPQNITCRDIGVVKLEGHCPEEEHCRSIECEAFSLNKHSSVQFELSGSAAFLNLEQYEGKISFSEDILEMPFKSFVKLSYDKQRYIQKTSDQVDQGGTLSHQKEIGNRAELIIPLSMYFIVSLGGAGGLLLLIICVVALYKCGFFKRKRPYGGLIEENGQEEKPYDGADENGQEENPKIPVQGANEPGSTEEECKGLSENKSLMGVGTDGGQV